jgi:hypothetical protein
MGSVVLTALGWLMIAVCAIRLIQGYRRPRPGLINSRWTTAGWGLLFCGLLISRYAGQHGWQPSQPRDALEVATFLAAGIGMAADGFLARRRHG